MAFVTQMFYLEGRRQRGARLPSRVVVAILSGPSTYSSIVIRAFVMETRVEPLSGIAALALVVSANVTKAHVIRSASYDM